MAALGVQCTICSPAREIPRRSSTAPSPYLRRANGAAQDGNRAANPRRSSTRLGQVLPSIKLVASNLPLFKHSLPDTTLVPPHPGHPKIAILSDSLAAIYMVQRVVRRPGTLSVHKHQPLLHHIYLLVLARAALGLRTSFHKVRAHTGVTGNEKADAGAGATLGDPASCEYWMPNNSHSLFPCLAAWLQTPDPNPNLVSRQRPAAHAVPGQPHCCCRLSC